MSPIPHLDHVLGSSIDTNKVLVLTMLFLTTGAHGVCRSKPRTQGTNTFHCNNANILTMAGVPNGAPLQRAYVLNLHPSIPLPSPGALYSCLTESQGMSSSHAGWNKSGCLNNASSQPGRSGRRVGDKEEGRTHLWATAFMMYLDEGVCSQLQWFFHLQQTADYHLMAK